MANELPLLFISIFLGVCAQFALKEGMQRTNITSFRSTGIIPLGKKLFLNPFVISGFVAYGIAMLLWLVVLSRLELSYAYPIVSSSYLFVVLGSKIIFKEHVSRRRWLAVSTIILGVFLIGIS